MIVHERLTNTHLFFLRGVFSNFQHCPSLIIDEIKFANTEQAFMYYKAIHFKDFEIAEKIKKETDPAKAKKLGRLVKNYKDDEWEKVRYSYMHKVNFAKFTQNVKFRKILIGTKELKLVETNGKDTIWGIGLYANDDNVLDESKWKGRNLLGEVLMQIRQYFFNLKGQN